MFKTIIVGFDGSGHSENALRAACDLAEKYDAAVHLVHTPQPQTVAFAMGAVAGYHALTTMPSPEEVAAAAQKVLAQAKAIASEHQQTLASATSDLGDPAKNIVQKAEQLDADLIVTGRRGVGAVGALVQGSTSLSVNHLARCACMSVE